MAFPTISRLAGTCAALLVALAWTPAQAAVVDLTSTITVNPHLSTLTPFTITLQYTNGLASSVATDSTIDITLPNNLYNLSVVGVTASGGANCPAASDLVLPTGVTAGSPVVQATIASLPTSGQCEIVLQATALSPGTFPFSTSIAHGPGDTEDPGNLGTNRARTNASITSLGARINVQKDILSGATDTGTVNSAGARVFNATGWDIVYRLTYTNDSDVDLPIGLAQDQWRDSELINSAPRPSDASTSAMTCTASDPGSVCPVLTAGTNNFSQGSATPLNINTSASVLKARSTMVIEFTRSYQPPACGVLELSNTAAWYVGATTRPIVPEYISGKNTSSVQVRFPQQTACTGLNIALNASKTFDGITDAAGAAVADAIIRNDGDTAHFTITLEGDQNYAVPVLLSDLYRNSSAGSNQPTFFPNMAGSLPSVRYTVMLDSCTITESGATGTTCPVGGWAGPLPKTLISNRSASVNFGVSAARMNLAPRSKVELKLRVIYNITHPDPASNQVLCRANLDTMINTITATVIQDEALANGNIFTGTTRLDRITSPLSLLSDNTPRCTNLTAAKQVNATSVTSGSPVEFTLDYTNSTQVDTRMNNTSLNAQVNPIENIQIRDNLGAHFTASDVSCQVAEGTATAPTVSLAGNIDANGLFTATIPSMHSGARVRCSIKGTSSLPGTYTNTTEVALPAGANLTEISLADNIGRQNYAVIGPQISLSKTTSATTVAPGDSLAFDVVVSNISATEAANGTRVQDPIAAGLSNVSWTCTASGTALCPNASGTGALDETIASLPVGSALTYRITGTVDAGIYAITNTASATPPAGGSCQAAGQAPVAGTCSASVSLTGTPPAPVVQVQKGAQPAAGSSVTAGNTIAYSVDVLVSNANTTDIVTLTDTLGAGLELVAGSFTTPTGASCQAAAQVITCTLPAGVTPGTYTFGYQANVAATATGTVGNSVAPSGGDNPACAANACTTSHPVTQTPVPVAQVEVSKISNPGSGSTVAAGSTITYSVDVLVSGANTTDVVTLTDTLSAGLELVAGSFATSAGVTCQAVAQVITCTLPAGTTPGTYTLSYLADVASTATGTLSNTVVPSGGDNPVCAANACTTSHPVASTPVPPAAQVAVVKRANPASGTSVAAGSAITYSVDVVISGANTRDVVTLTDTLGSGLELLAGSFTTPAGAAGAACQAAAQVLTCTLPAGTAPGSYTFGYQANVAASATGTVSNTVAPSGGDNPACAANACTSTHPVTPAQIVSAASVSKNASPASGSAVVAGQVIAYTLNVVVEHAATGDAITLTDTLGAGLQYVAGSAVAPAGGRCSVAGQVLTCTLDAGAAVGTHSFRYAATAAATGTLENTVVPTSATSTRLVCGQCNTVHRIGSTTPSTPGNTTAVPAHAPWAVLALLMLLGLWGSRSLHAQRKR